MPYAVYTLSDPSTDVVRYVGKARNPVKRLAYHIRESLLGRRSHKCHWILTVLEEDLQPVLTILAQFTSDAEAYQFEQATILKLRSEGVPLTNGTDGGPGCSNPSAEVRERMAAGQRGRVATPEAREAMSAAGIGKPHPWVSTRLKGVPKSDEHRRKISAALTKPKVVNEQLVKLPRVRIAPTEETKQKMREAMARHYVIPGNREKVREKTIAVHQRKVNS